MSDMGFLVYSTVTMEDSRPHFTHDPNHIWKSESFRKRPNARMSWILKCTQNAVQALNE